ncbi:putative transposase [Halodesulfovibrio aestuarii]|uniref:Putative transposase n=1 Tax=Halodesulfovibrio aestuarii TaxID=126333 RepID=A0A8G2C7X5_9BACT|nr:putative transposase [Halodesulfovibrio aestuarii]
MLTSELRDEPLFQSVSQARVAKHMRALRLRCKYAKKFIPTTDSAYTEPVAPNLLDRNFTTSAPDMAWVTDITYIKVGRKWHYLTVLIDLYSRMVVGWDFSDSLERHSVIHALKKTVARRKPSSGILIHSDRGVQYASKDFRRCLKKHGYIQSMSRKGNFRDNAVAESFFQTIKNQLIRHRRFKTKHEAELALFNYIEAYYNLRRQHSSNDWLFPATFKYRNEQYDLVA